MEFKKNFNFKKGGKIMKITMNACTINNVGNMTIVNGRVMSGGCYSLAEFQKIDETKRIGAEEISRIKVDSDLADVTIAASNRTDIEAHYYGEVCTDGKLEFDVTTSGDKINVSAKINGSTFNGNLKLNVFIPQKVFRLISVKCQNGSIEICKNVEAERLKIDSQYGSIESKAIFEEITAKSMNGSIDISISAKSNIEISASSMNGNVSVELENIGSYNISTSSMNGSTRNRHNSTGRYKATGDISSMNGSVRVQ